MPKVRFIGDPNDDYSGPSRMPWRGHTFVKGEFIDVPQSVADAALRHTHFEVEGATVADTETAIARNMTEQEIRDLLDQRGVIYTKNAKHEKLLELLAASEGGIPGNEEA